MESSTRSERSIASATWRCMRPGAAPIEIRPEVGRPYRTAGGSWACPVSVGGLYEALPDVHGEDAIQALSLALSLVRQLLTQERSSGARICLRDRDEDVPLDATFSAIGSADASL